uniref:hypothetical protein n=1 Tax=Aliirhizobium smilacinae TaxID=1395944 RepID=UPI001FE9FBB4|nr:hypothetical protein [Rhizobium smilacinae]
MLLPNLKPSTPNIAPKNLALIAETCRNGRILTVEWKTTERDLRGFVIKRKISGGTVSRNGRQARDSMLGLMKTCQKLGLSFWHYLGDRLGIGTSHRAITPLATMIAVRA